MSLLLDLQVAQPDQPRGFISTNGQSSGHVANIVGLAGSALLWGSVAVFAPAPVVEAVPLKVISAAPQFDPTQPQPYFKIVVIQQFQAPPLRTSLYARGQDSNEQPAPRITTPSFAPVQPNPQTAQYGYGTQATLAASQSAGGVWGQRLALVPPVVSDPVPFKQVNAYPQYVEPTQPLISRTFIPPLLEVPQRPSLYAKGQDSNELLQPGIFKQAPTTVAADALLFGTIRTASPQVPPDIAPLVWRVQIQQFQAPPLRPTLFAKEQESGFQPAPVISVTLQVPAAQDPILRPIVYARAEDSTYQPAPQVHFGAELPSVAIVPEVTVVVRRDSSGGIKKPRKKRDYFIQDALYEERIKVSIEKSDSIHTALKPTQVESVIAGTMQDLIPQNSLIVSEEDLELVLAALHYLDKT